MNADQALASSIRAAAMADAAVKAVLGNPARVYDDPPTDVMFPYVFHHGKYIVCGGRSSLYMQAVPGYFPPDTDQYFLLPETPPEYFLYHLRR